MRRFFVAWVLCSALLCTWVYARSRLVLVAAPDAASARFAYAALAAAMSGSAAPEAPPGARAYHAAGPIFVSAYVAGERRARHVGFASLAQVVQAAAQQFARDPSLRAARAHVYFRVAVTRGSGPLLEIVPILSSFSLVPLRDGVSAQRAQQIAYLTPDDLMEHGATDRAMAGAVPDLTYGTDLGQVRELLAGELGMSERLDGTWRMRRLCIEALPDAAVERPSPTRQALLAAARDNVAFVLRHQDSSGRFTYIYDSHRNEALPGAVYNLARHAGTMFFLARAAQQLGLPAARIGALRGLSFIRENVLATCGAAERLCIEQGSRVEFGASALTALACAELLRGSDDAEVRRTLAGLLGFLRAQQRPDGEMMHEYSREQEAPIDVQHMYYSGEAALALLTGYERQNDVRDLQAAARLMTHLTGHGWAFFGARYYYGEEHWTCQAAAKAAEHMAMGPALDFCLRWGRWQEHLQYRAGVTPWDVEGAFGVGPVLLPRVTTAASRIEALVPTYRVLLKQGQRREALASMRTLIERGLGLLLRMRWAPGPQHLFAQPVAAFGGIPSTGADLRSRVDMVQHSGSAFLAWAEALALGY